MFLFAFTQSLICFFTFNNISKNQYDAIHFTLFVSDNPAVELAEELEQAYKKFDLFSLKKLTKDLEYIRGFSAWLFNSDELDGDLLEQLIHGTITAIDYPYYLT